MTTRPREIKIVDDKTEEIGCDGGGGALGHPKVYLTLGEHDQIDCPYCGRHFTLKPGAKRGGGH